MTHKPAGARGVARAGANRTQSTEGVVVPDVGQKLYKKDYKREGK